MIMIRCNGFKSKLRSRGGGRRKVTPCGEQMLVDIAQATNDEEFGRAMDGSGWSLVKVKVSVNGSKEVDAVQPLCNVCARKLAVAVRAAEDAVGDGGDGSIH
jgi:hypothetical protein